MIRKTYMKYKEELVIFLVVATIYTLISGIFFYNTTILYETKNTFDVILDSDSGVLFERNIFVENKDNNKHILFSKIVSIIAYPIFVISQFLSSKIGIRVDYLYGIGLTLLQIAVSSISITLIFSYLKSLKLNKTTLYTIMGIFLFSFPQLFMSLSIERFIYAQLSIILFIYLVHKNKNKENYLLDLAAIPLFGITVSNIYIYVLNLIIKYKTQFKKYIKHLTVFALTSYIVIIMTNSISLLNTVSGIKDNSAYVFNGTWIEKIKMILFRLLYPSIYFPGNEITTYGENGISYKMMQTDNINIIYFVIFMIILCLCIASIIINRKDDIVKLSAAIILFNIFMHGIVGFNLLNANIMTIHFGFAIIILLAHFCKNIKSENIKSVNLFLIIVLTTVILSNGQGFIKIFNLGVQMLPRL